MIKLIQIKKQTNYIIKTKIKTSKVIANKDID